MKASPTVMQTFALNNEGRIVHIDEVLPGGDCGCRCPNCDTPLIARQGEGLDWHFVHHQESACEGAVETALHRAAQQLLHDEPGLMLPGLLVSENWIAPSGVTHPGAAMVEPCWIDFDQVLLEPAVGLIRPDAIALQAGQTWILEVRVHHAVDMVKRQRIAAIGWPAVEIILDPLGSEAWTLEALRRQVIDRHDNKRWLHHPERPALIDKARAAAKAQAVLQGPCMPVNALSTRPVTARGSAEPIRHRFRVRNLFVDATEREFAITVWSSFHPEVTPMVADICRRLGGSWRRHYRNWVVSHLNRAALLAALTELADGGSTSDSTM